MKFLKITFFCLIFPVVINAQFYEKTLIKGNYWDVDCYYFFSNEKIIETRYSITCDTIINNKNYYIVYGDPLYFPQGHPFPCDRVTGFVREDTIEQKVYRLEVGATDEKLIVNYKLEIGDTFQINGNERVIDSIGVAYFYEKNRKVIYTSGDSGHYELFIEGIGYAGSGLFYTTCGNLLDFQNSDLDCDSFLEVSNIVTDNAIIIYPNPTSCRLRIELIDGGSNVAKRGVIRNTNGQVMKTFFIRYFQDIDVHNFLEGLYFIEIEQFKTMKFLKNN